MQAEDNKENNIIDKDSGQIKDKYDMVEAEKTTVLQENSQNAQGSQSTDATVDPKINEKKDGDPQIVDAQPAEKAKKPKKEPDFFGGN